MLLVALSIYGGGFAVATLSNLVGYASSNLVALIRLMTLWHRVAPPLALDESVAEKELVITSFEVGSYGHKLSRTADVLLRIEQNNNVIGMLRARLQLPPGFAEVVAAHLRLSDQDSPLEEAPRYLFDFLARSLVERGLVGVAPQLEVAPAPYLSLPKRWTLVV